MEPNCFIHKEGAKVFYEYFISFFLAFIIAFSSTPIAKKLAFNIGAVDIPKDNRRMHKKPIARLGGLAIVAGFVVSVMFSIAGSALGLKTVFQPDVQLMGILAGVAIIVGIGIVDDIRQLGARIKLVFQIAAAVVVVSTGTVIENFTNPFSVVGVSQLSPYISYPLTVLWIVGITNAINLIDGLDGLAAGVSSIASLSLFFISIIQEDWNTAIVTAALAGSALGFLPYNFNPAKIFMGDTGATFLGFTLGVISIQGMYKSFTAIAIAVPLLVLGLPIFDTAFAILRRLVQGKSIMQADRGHLHHKLIDMGLSHKQSVVVMYVASGALGLCAIVLADKGVLGAIILFIAVSVFIVGGARYMSEISDGSEEEDAGDGTDTEEKDKTTEDEEKKTRNVIIEKINES